MDNMKPKKKFVMVDVEANGPCPGLFSMISIGAVLVECDTQFVFPHTFYGELRPLEHAHYDVDALNACKFTHEQTLLFPDAATTITDFDRWLKSLNIQPMFVSDNNGFDWQFVNWYMWMVLGRNPFGHSSQNLGSLFKGINRNMFDNFKHLRTVEHTHNALDDALGNAGAMMKIKHLYGVKW